MMRPTARLIVCVFALLIFGGFAAPAEDHTPKPYSPDEFPVWMKEMWRAEVIAVGSFPFTLFATLEVYDSVRYFSNALNPSYAPWPFGSGSAASYSASESGWLAVSAVSLSAVIAAIDFVIGRLNAQPSHD